jgi:phosphoribosylanthranilate isomerase
MRAADPPARLREILSRPLVKVCGLTREEDVAAAVDAGADLCGFILVRESPRAAERVLPVPDTTLSVAVFVGAPGEAEADLVQVHEREEGKVRGRDGVLLHDGAEVATVIDRPWGVDDDPTQLDRARAIEGRLMLAGGLDAANVRQAIAATDPWAVDASSSLESSPGVKDHEKVRAYVAAAR